MCLADVRIYIRNRMETLGYEEWRDGFNVENIPSTMLERSFHIESGDIAPTASNHQVHQFISPLIVRVYLKGYHDPVEAIDQAMETAEEILEDILLPSNRLGTEVKDVTPTNISVKPLNDQNDNAVILELGFDATTLKRF